MQHIYLIALGSNRRHVRFGRPRDVLAAATEAVGRLGDVLDCARPISSRPIGPSRRTFANGALLLATELEPQALLRELKIIEGRFGRRGGRRWGQRTLDLDIILWSGGVVADDRLCIPHPEFRGRDFVLGPACTIAADWRDPLTALTVRHLAARRAGPGRAAIIRTV